MQEKLQNKQFVLKKIRGDRNPADVLTKPLGVSDVKTKIEYVEGKIVDRNGSQCNAGRERWADISSDAEAGLGEEEEWCEDELNQFENVDE